ncbi:MAG: hypothetical protein K2X38_03810 [Gemmataceae bacterium]|nr:hypothetical protein [Gemmataceae bacterium]
MIRFFEIVVANLAVASLLAVIAGSAGRWLKRPALTHGLWMLVLAKMITPPLIGVPVLFPAAESSDVPNHRMVAEIPKQADPREEFGDLNLDSLPNLDWNEIFDGAMAPLDVIPAPERIAEHAIEAPVPPAVPIDWASRCLISLAAVWAAGSVVWFVAAWVRLRRFAACVNRGLPASADLQTRVGELADRLGVAPPSTVLLQGVVSPMLWVRGFAGRLILPAELLPRLAGQQGDALLLHELAHWKRGDHWVRRLEMLVLGVYWWCPLAWWAKSRIEECEEECCDAWVVSTFPDAAGDYALALVETLDFLADSCPALPPTASGLGRLTSLQRRLTMIVRGPFPRALTVGGALALLGVGALLLPLAPSRAQTPEIQKQIEKALVELAQDQNPPRKEGDRPKDGDRPKEGPRDGDQPKKGPRDGDRPKKGNNQNNGNNEGNGNNEENGQFGRNDGDPPRKGPRKGDSPREPRKDGDRPQPGGNPEVRELMEQLRTLEAEVERARADTERKMRMLMEVRRRVMDLQEGGGPDRKEFRPPVVGSDTERRLGELERKMDMILRALRRDSVSPMPPLPPASPVPPRTDRKEGPPPPPRKEGGPRREGAFDIEVEIKR